MTLRLMADIGGTNARFAVAENAQDLTPTILPVADFERFEDALDAFLSTSGVHLDNIGSCAVAAAGPVSGGVVNLTNAPWVIDTHALKRRVECPVGMLNDLEAVACALPVLSAEDTEIVRAGTRDSGDGLAPMIAVNVGTGFGAAVAVPARGAWYPLATEPGHMLLGEGPGTIEDMLSGPGLARLRETGGDVRGVFSTALGRVTRDLVLATGSWGGVRFCGGVMGAWDDVIDEATFHEGFGADSTGPMAERLAAVTLARIIHPLPAMLGLLNAPIDDA